MARPWYICLLLTKKISVHHFPSLTNHEIFVYFTQRRFQLTIFQHTQTMTVVYFSQKISAHHFQQGMFKISSLMFHYLDLHNCTVPNLHFELEILQLGLYKAQNLNICKFL
uniref:Uncharacterized protein n=1 Tax=Arundo donax TaxID=35708 RepID=A0A0A9F399_ARUDO